MDGSRRQHRQLMRRAGFKAFTCRIKETDMYVAVDEASYCPQLERFVEQRVLYYRTLLEDFIAADPVFRTTLQPYLLSGPAPALVLDMVRAGNLAGVGPMAAVAGAIAEYVGRDLQPRVQQVIVENGGDIYFRKDAVRWGLCRCFTMSNRLAVAIAPQGHAFGVCTLRDDLVRL